MKECFGKKGGNTSQGVSGLPWVTSSVQVHSSILSAFKSVSTSNLYDLWTKLKPSQKYIF